MPGKTVARSPFLPVTSRGTAGILVGSFFLFVVVSRLPEVMGNAFGTSFKIALVMSVLSGFLGISSGRLTDTLSRPAALTILVFTGWWIVGIPFSFWPGGSAALLQQKWIISLVTFFIIGTLPVSSRCLKLYGGAMAWSAIFVMMALLRYGTSEESRSSMQFSSSLSNPNIAALQLLLGFPFLIYWTRTRGFFNLRGVLGFAGAILLAVLIVTRTGSRSGLVILIVVSLILLAGVKLHIRLAMFVALVLGAVAVVPFIPDYLLYRYGTMLATDVNDTSEAAESTRARAEHLRESLVLTAIHPLFGVGAGQFQGASALLEKAQGQKALWRETHNMYTQISSETGLLGILIYLTMIYLSFGPVWRDLRIAKRTRNLQPRHEFARALLISAMGLVINSCFTSIAYELYWPILCAMGVAYQRVAVTEDAANAGAAIASRGVPDRGAQRFMPGMRSLNVKSGAV